MLDYQTIDRAIQTTMISYAINLGMYPVTMRVNAKNKSIIKAGTSKFAKCQGFIEKNLGEGRGGNTVMVATSMSLWSITESRKYLSKA